MEARSWAGGSLKHSCYILRPTRPTMALVSLLRRSVPLNGWHETETEGDVLPLACVYSSLRSVLRSPAKSKLLISVQPFQLESSDPASSAAGLDSAPFVSRGGYDVFSWIPWNFCWIFRNLPVILAEDESFRTSVASCSWRFDVQRLRAVRILKIEGWDYCCNGLEWIHFSAVHVLVDRRCLKFQLWSECPEVISFKPCQWLFSGTGRILSGCISISIYVSSYCLRYWIWVIIFYIIVLNF